MIKMTDQWCIQVDITNVCVGHDCLYCSRYNRHIRNDQKYFMPLEQVDKVLNSLVGWPKTIGIIGGEPILHPQFIDICKQIQKIFPKEKMGLWTSGGHKYQEYLPTINETFGFVAFNEHSEHQKNTCKHQPLSLAISEVVEDELLVEKLVDNCWTQKNWCGTSNKFGSYFCEISAAIDLILFDGAHAWPTEGHWWDKSPEQYKEQREALCKFCGMALPVDRELIKNTKEKETISKAKSLGIQGYIVKATSVPSEVVEKVWEIANLKK